jgi:4-hydroxy-tetrahydrodipicolinate synthase
VNGYSSVWRSCLLIAFPKKFTTMVNKALQGKFSEAAKQTFEFLSINTLMYHEGNPTGIKAALHIKKVCEDYMRLPLLKASKELKEKIKSNSSHLE